MSSSTAPPSSPPSAGAVFAHHVIDAEPRCWEAVARRLRTESGPRLAQRGGALYGVWRSQIGRPRDELTAITVWRAPVLAAEAGDQLVDGLDQARVVESVALVPTLRPLDQEPPRRQGNYAFRWMETPARHFPEFLELCAAAWPGFESAYDSQVVGLWRVVWPGSAWDAGDRTTVRSLLLTRRPSLAMWERSKIPQGEAERAVREKLSRRYDLCDSTWVYTTTLLSAEDGGDTVRWT